MLVGIELLLLLLPEILHPPTLPLHYLLREAGLRPTPRILLLLRWPPRALLWSTPLLLRWPPRALLLPRVLLWSTPLLLLLRLHPRALLRPTPLLLLLGLHPRLLLLLGLHPRLLLLWRSPRALLLLGWRRVTPRVPLRLSGLR